MAIDLNEAFESHNDEFLKFDRIEVKRSKRADMHAFLLLDELQPRERKIVGGASHDQIWLDADCTELAENITEAQILELVRCGIMFDSESESLYMFV